MKKGIKVCKSCGTENGVRAYECKKCDAEFEMRRKRRGLRKRIVTDWTQLKSGDIVEPVGRSGPYYTNALGERTYTNTRGYKTVYKIDDDGLVVTGKYGFEFLYCGPERKGIVSSLTQAPTRVKLVTGNTDPIAARRQRNRARRS